MSFGLQKILRGEKRPAEAGRPAVSPEALRLDLRNRVALVTGSTGQLGRVIARTLAACGADIALHYLRQHDVALQLEQELKERGGRGLPVQADVTDLASVERMHEEIAVALGDPDIVVCNAVSQFQWHSVMDQPLEDYESQFRSSLLHAVIAAKVFVPAMIKRRYGRIIALNTELVMLNQPKQGAYIGGKRGMDGVLRVLAREIGEHQITVNQIAPGRMITELVRQEGKERQKSYESQVPLRRRGTDQDVANLVAFLASDLASFITGAFIPVCGGNVMSAI